MRVYRFLSLITYVSYLYSFWLSKQGKVIWKELNYKIAYLVTNFIHGENKVPVKYLFACLFVFLNQVRMGFLSHG